MQPLDKSPSYAPVHLSSIAFPAHRRLEMWLQLYYGRVTTRAELQPIGNSRFDLSATIQRLPGVWLTSLSGSPIRSTMERKHFHNVEERIAVIVSSSGSSFAQLGRDIDLSAGAGVVASMNDPFVDNRYCEGRVIGVAVARSKLAGLVPDAGAVFGRAIPPNNEALQLLTRYIGALSQGGGPATPALAQSIANHIIDLMAIAIGPTADAAHQGRQRGLAAARLMAIKATVSGRLRDPDLSVDMVARLHGLTTRYVHKLFEREGTTFSAFVLERRLLRTRNMLQDPGCLARTIATIAFDCGFNDLSYFNRTFRRAFGGTPSDIRDAALRENDFHTEPKLRISLNSG
jgi:AraC-like DNA-binding protein